MSGRRAVCIGGGITGVLAARELALAGWDVVVLEGRHVGAGSSSRTAAGIRQQFSTPETVRGMRYSVDFYQRFTAEVEDGTCPIVQSGYLFLYDAEDSWASALRRVEMQRSCGLSEVEALAGDDLRRRFPWCADTLVGGTFCPTDGFLLPHVVYQEGAKRVTALGGRVLQNAPVTSAAFAGDRIVAVDTPKGSFEADLFLDCTNAWTRRLARVLGAEDLEVDPLKRYLWFLARDGSMDAETLSRMPLCIVPSGMYCRPENADTLLMGGSHATPPEPDFAYDDQDRIEPHYAHDGGVDAHPWTCWAEIAEAIPAVGEFGGMTATTAGYYATTPDHNPFLGYDRQRTNLLRLVGFSGHGAMFGPFTALVARALAEAGQDLPSVEVDGAAVPLDAFRIGRAFDHAEALVL
ncbi:MAG: FAD-binding oxidoreductase [Alphaproteobacteria bacterium]|nr:FAD-binding oxidoreductase [Alphaproteobacteria bacterium]